MTFPNRELFEFRIVLAFPNDSKIGELANICDTKSSFSPLLFVDDDDDAAVGVGDVKLAKCFNTILIDSVFPEPDSPETIMV